MPKYLPSSFLNEIEKPLRRGFRSERTKIPLWTVVVIWLLVATFAYALVARIVDDQAHASYVANKDLCDRYLNDSSLAGTAAKETLKQICL